MTEEMSESRFYMWRAIFAMAHADRVVTEEELRFMYNVLRAEKFTDAQKAVLEEDMEKPQNIVDMFMKISEQEDRSRFFYFARMLCWCDGNFGAQEQQIITILERINIRSADFDEMVSSVSMEFDEEQKQMIVEDMRGGDNPIATFFRRFSGKSNKRAS